MSKQKRKSNNEVDSDFLRKKRQEKQRAKNLKKKRQHKDDARLGK